MRHRAVLFGTLLAVIGLISLDGASHTGNVFTQTAVAQEAAAPAAAPEAAAAPATAPAGQADEEPPKEQNMLEWLYQSLGVLYLVVFLSLSFTFVALFVMNMLSARRENVCPVALVEGFEAHLNEKQYQEAYELAKADESFLGQVLSAGLAKLSACSGRSMV